MTWGHTFHFPCGHRCIVFPTCDIYWTPHWCPLCDGRREPECRCEYRDVQRGEAPAEGG